MTSMEFVQDSMSVSWLEQVKKRTEWLLIVVINIMDFQYNKKSYTLCFLFLKCNFEEGSVNLATTKYIRCK